MDSCTNNNSVRAHAIIEAFKTEALNSCITMLKRTNRELPPDAEAFIMSNVELWLDNYEITKTYDMTCYSLPLFEDNDEELLFVKVDDVNDIFIDFKKRLTSAILQLILYDLELFLARKEIEIDE